jgi:hypothetical protein
MSVGRTSLTIKRWKAGTAPRDNTIPTVHSIPDQSPDVGAPPSKDDALDYLLTELQVLQGTIDSLVLAAPQAYDAAPLNPVDGLIRRAEGAWAASLAYIGMVAYDGGAWYGLLNDGANIYTGRGVSTGQVSLELGQYRTGNGVAFIDFHATAGTDLETRVIRNGGVNGSLDIYQTGTGQTRILTGTVSGGFTVTAAFDAAACYLYPTGAVSSSTTFASFNAREIHFLQNGGDEAAAGTIGYRKYTGNSLDIVGAGTTTSNRIVQVYDRLFIGAAEAVSHLGMSAANPGYIKYSNGVIDQFGSPIWPGGATSLVVTLPITLASFFTGISGMLFNTTGIIVTALTASTVTFAISGGGSPISNTGFYWRVIGV